MNIKNRNRDEYKAHQYCSNHRKAIEASDVVGCFYCTAIYDPKEITEWVDDPGGTALCSNCGIDSVIGSKSGYPITREFLNKMHRLWF